MSRRAISPMHIFALVCVLSGVFALLPLRYVRWVEDLASIVRLPAFPFTDLGSRVRVWMGGGPARNAPAPDDARFLQHELERMSTLANEWRRRAEELARMNAQLQNTQVYGLDVPFAPVMANIVMGASGSTGDTYTLNVGSHRHAVSPGTVAVYEGAHLIGRIAEVSRLSSELVPVTDASFELLRAYVDPGEPGFNTDESRPTVHLENQEDGTFAGVVPTAVGVTVGDYVYLDDPSWQRTAQSMIIGRVVLVEPKADNPVLVRIVVRPVYTAESLSTVTLKVEGAGASEGAGRGGGP